MTETVFEILAEGGSLTIERKRDRNEEKFIYHHSEMKSDDEGIGVNENGEYENFAQPFQLINSTYPWFELHLTTLHEDYRDYVLSELIIALNKQGVTPDDLSNSKQDLEKSLNTKLEFGNMPLKNGLQNIKVLNLIKLTEYDYLTNSEDSNKQDRLLGKYEMWTDEQTYYPENMEVLRASNNFETVGKLEIEGNAIVIKNEFDQIDYIFPSDKFFVSAKPVISETKGWYFVSR